MSGWSRANTGMRHFRWIKEGRQGVITNGLFTMYEEVNNILLNWYQNIFWQRLSLSAEDPWLGLWCGDRATEGRSIPDSVLPERGRAHYFYFFLFFLLLKWGRDEKKGVEKKEGTEKLLYVAFPPKQSSWRGFRPGSLFGRWSQNVEWGSEEGEIGEGRKGNKGSVIDLVAMMGNHIPSYQNSLRNLEESVSDDLYQKFPSRVLTPHTFACFCTQTEQLLKALEKAQRQKRWDLGRAHRAVRDTCMKSGVMRRRGIGHRSICYWNDKMLATLEN